MDYNNGSFSFISKQYKNASNSFELKSYSRVRVCAIEV